MLKVQLKLVYVAVCLFAATLHVSAQDVGSGDNNKENQSGKLDLIFLLDASGSVGQENFDVMTNWVIQLTSALDISDGSVRVGVIKYSFYDRRRPLNSQIFISTEIPLGAHRDQMEFNAAVSNIRTTNLQTFTAHALLKSINDFRASERFDDPLTAKLLIVVTDGKATDADLLESSAAQVRDAGITTYAVGVGDADRTELEKLTAGNNPNQVYHVNNFDNLSTITNAVFSAIQKTRATSLITSTHATTTTQQRYSAKLDLIFLLDASGSVGQENFSVMKKWVIQLTSALDISDGSVRVGVIRYSLYIESIPLNSQRFISTEIPLGAHRDQMEFNAAMSNITTTNFQTFTAHALLKSISDFRASERFDDPTTAKVLIVVTDGEATDADLLESAAAHVRDAGITTYAVGVGDAAVGQLVYITARDDNQRVFHVRNFKSLSTIANALSTAIRTTEGTMSSFALTTTPSITTTSFITSTPSTTTTQPRYSGKLDLIFLLDGSGSVRTRNFEIVRNWIIHLTNEFDISSGATRVGVIQYLHYVASRHLSEQSYVVTEIQLGAHQNQSSFNAAVSRITSQRYTTYTAQAMLKSIDDFRASDRFNDPSTRKVLVVLTDGKASDEDSLESSAAQVRDAGITTYAVGVGDADRTELEIITARDDDSRVFYVSNFNNLSTIASRLSSALKATEDE